MAIVRIPISNEVLLWAMEQSDKELDEIKSKFAIDKWLKKEREPTFKQLKDLSNQLHIPFGYFMLKSPPKEDTTLLEYRTIKTKGVTKPSRNLLDTIDDMKRKQAWMRDYLFENGYNKLKYVDSISKDGDPNQNVNHIRNKLNLSENWHRNTNDRRETFNYLRKKVSDIGILVMQNGTALNNTHRSLNVNEFRAFALVDDYAPLIFINSTDTLSGKIFSLLHEVAHIFFGVNSLYNDTSYYNEDDYADDIEIYCNRIAAEILVPNISFRVKWKANTDIGLEQRIVQIANTYKVSEIVIARRALDNKMINKRDYYEVVNNVLEKLENNLDKRSSGGGGDFYTTAQSRLDHNFFKILANDVRRNRTTNTTAYKLTGLSRITFNQLENVIKGVNH